MITYYRTRMEAEAHRKKGERVYHHPGRGYYLDRLKSQDPSYSVVF